MIEKIYNLKMVLELVPLTDRQIKSEMQKGKLLYKKVGRAYLITESNLNAWLNDYTRPASGSAEQKANPDVVAAPISTKRGSCSKKRVVNAPVAPKPVVAIVDQVPSTPELLLPVTVIPHEDIKPDIFVINREVQIAC